MPNLDAQKFLANLNSQRAFFLFLAALFVGILLVFGGWGKPFAPVLPVIGYGVALIVAQEVYFVQLGPNTGDSPYFLGFILTLIEILDVLLIGLPQQDRLGNFLYREIGAAILTTVGGLMARQRLISNDTAAEAQDRIFRRIADEVRKDIGEFHQTQKIFVGLIREFTQTREEMFSEEEKAFAEYLKALRDGALKLGALPKRVETTLTALDASGSRIAQITAQLEKTLQESVSTYQAGVQGLVAAFSTGRTLLDSECASLAKTIGNVANGLSGHTTTLGQMSSSAAQAVADFQKVVAEFSSSFGAGKKDIEIIVKDLQRIAADLAAVDQIADDLIRVLRDHITSFDKALSQNERTI
jgi:hypothetical protein